MAVTSDSRRPSTAQYWKGIAVTISRILGGRRRLAALPIVAALAAAACAPSQQARGGGSSGAVPDTITIGATLPLTGTESKAGARQKEGYELAVEIGRASCRERV